MPLHDQWPPEKKLEVVRGLDDNTSSWLKDHDFYKKYYLGSPNKEKLSETKGAKHDLGVVTLVQNMIASQKTPYKNWGEFDRDSVLKNFRAQAIILGEDGMIAAAEEAMNHQESDHRAFMREKNKKFLQNQREDFENADKVSDWRKVYDLCKKAERYMVGKQLMELRKIIADCEERLS